MTEAPAMPPHPPTNPDNQFLCLTICGYRRPGMSEEDYRHHMTKVSAPMTKDLMVKYGIHNTSESRALMSRLYDHQMTNLADFDCFSQVVFKSVDDYKRMKEDPWYKEHLMGDHEKFADTKRSTMTIGWITEFIRDGEYDLSPYFAIRPGHPEADASDELAVSRTPIIMSATVAQATAVVTGAFLSGAMMSLSLVAVPVFLDTTDHAPQLFGEWARMYHYGHQALPTMAVGTLLLYGYTAARRRSAGKSWRTFALAGLTTVCMLPFTWLIMVPGNNELFRLETVSKTEPLVMGIDDARQLVTNWAQLHFMRTLFPLAGAIVGVMGMLGSYYE
ncbi:hypothetical protein DL767_000910 [Monosporascus sp. MG133]|nr:hypothetical protein DL767_000910 [Monosporascus sp. MG133]